MKIKNSIWLAMILGLILITMLSCALPIPTRLAATQTPTPGAASSSGSTSGDSAGGAGGSNAGGSQGGSGSSNGPASSPAPTLEPSPAPTLPTTPGGPYQVKQIVSLGHETISGLVCDTAKPFIVSAVAPEVSWNFVFVPSNDSRGNFTYAYNIPKAGESHDAKGTYTIAPANAANTLLLSMVGSDHVVFKGFDGSFPVKYEFNLVSTGGPPCPQP